MMAPRPQPSTLNLDSEPLVLRPWSLWPSTRMQFINLLLSLDFES